MVSKSLDSDKRKQLLEDFQRLNPDADATAGNISRLFLPLPEYRRVLDDRVVLVLGDRGVGKSALFHFLQSDARAKIETANEHRAWIVGFSESGLDHPPPLALEQLVADKATSEESARSFWLGHLVGRIADSVGAAVAPEPPGITSWRSAPTNPTAWIGQFRDPTGLLLWLDSVERHLANQRKVIVVTYDHLDRIGVRNREARRRLLPPLLALWLSFSNRYNCIKAKIFLRQDLFRESVPQTSDVSKLQARAETIRWTTSALYRLLIRHMAESGAGLREWLQQGMNGIPLENDASLGWMPPTDLPETGPVSQVAFMEHLVGKAMGDTTDPRAGYPHRWVPARLADANGAIAPRSMITLFWSAARNALSVGPQAGYLRLLTPDEMKNGLRDTSERRVSELAEEHPVVERLRSMTATTLPLSIPETTELLSTILPDDSDGYGSAGDRVVDELFRLGVFSRVGKDRIDVPDIYRLHFGIKRKGQKIATAVKP